MSKLGIVKELSNSPRMLDTVDTQRCNKERTDQVVLQKPIDLRAVNSLQGLVATGR